MPKEHINFLIVLTLEKVKIKDFLTSAAGKKKYSLLNDDNYDDIG